jgi:hypothetical protein
MEKLHNKSTEDPKLFFAPQIGLQLIWYQVELQEISSFNFKSKWDIYCVFNLCARAFFLASVGRERERERGCGNLMFLTSTKVSLFCVLDKHIEVATRSSCFVRLCVSFKCRKCDLLDFFFHVFNKRG